MSDEYRPVALVSTEASHAARTLSRDLARKIIGALGVRTNSFAFFRVCRQRFDVKELSALMRMLIAHKKAYVERRDTKHPSGQKQSTGNSDHEIQRAQNVQKLFSQHRAGRDLKMQLLKRDLGRRKESLQGQTQHQQQRRRFTSLSRIHQQHRIVKDNSIQHLAVDRVIFKKKKQSRA